MDRSLEMVVGLSALKAGGAFVPLDTEAPTARIRKWWKMHKHRLSFRNRACSTNCRLKCEHYVYLDQAAELDAYPTTAPQVDVTASSRSIYYTSGSTGKPKGVSNTHCRLGEPHGAGCRTTTS